MIKNRNVALYIVLSIVTCGIFALYWFVCLADDMPIPCRIIRAPAAA